MQLHSYHIHERKMSTDVESCDTAPGL